MKIQKVKHPQPEQIYTYKNKLYIIVRNVSAKHPDSGDWVLSVLYFGLEKQDFYVRELNDFCEKFKPQIGKIEYAIT